MANNVKVPIIVESALFRGIPERQNNAKLFYYSARQSRKSKTLIKPLFTKNLGKIMMRYLRMTKLVIY